MDNKRVYPERAAYIERVCREATENVQSKDNWVPTSKELEEAADHCAREYMERMEAAINSRVYKPPTGMTASEIGEFILMCADDDTDTDTDTVEVSFLGTKTRPIKSILKRNYDRVFQHLKFR
jgi:hypothetical protein